MNYYLRLIFALALIIGQVFASSSNETDVLREDEVLQRGLNAQFHSFLERLRIVLRTGNSTFGIPPLDPFAPEPLNLTIKEDQVVGTAALKDLIVIGLTGFVINKAEVGLLTVKLAAGFTWPAIHAQAGYKLDIVLFRNTRIYGEGEFTMTATGLSFECSLKFSVFGSLKIQKIQTNISLTGLAFKATGIFNDDDASAIISAAISDAAPQLVKDYQVELTNYINAEITKYANAQLKGKTFEDIIKLFY